ncbi:MAG: T9SS type A sorting domain-containing protein [Alphaproteobacteria bacterium]|nr:T9SS type A sorting domain-containing protein [Alphaproteobacteria bacterium]
MRRNILVVVVILFSILAATAGEVTETVARQVGIHFFHEKINRFTATDLSTIKVVETIPIRVNDREVFYIFNLEPAGFVVVSAIDAVVPALAYSFEGWYRTEDAPPQCRAWMKQYEDQIADARIHPIQPRNEIRRLWDRYLHYDAQAVKNLKQTSGGAVAPLITSNWNQNSPYNGQCPADPAGPGGHTYAGCVPVCMGQLMYYYRWPGTGTGSYSYEDPDYGTISADFGSTNYDWSNMTNSTTVSNPGIAQLLFHLGVSCDLDYGPDGSGMYNHKAAYALRTFFRYSPETQYLFRDSTNLNWDSVLIAHLDRRMPLYYAGWSIPNVDGHAFVCDGYQDSAFFHFNFGWSGQNNGYFYTTNLTPGGYNFKLAQEMIINAFPDTVNNTFPAYCAGQHILPYPAGSLTDGSGPVHRYLPASDCSWLIDPQTEEDSVTSITFTWDHISIEPADQLTVYNGPDASYPVLGTFSGDTIPAPLTGTSNKMFIHFTSGADNMGHGFTGTYTCKMPVWCTATQSILADTVDFTDGSFGFNYRNNTVCKWKVEKKSGGPLTLYFRRFDTEPVYDLLKIYDQSNGLLLATLSGACDSASLPDPVTAESGKALLIFLTNSTVTAKGWEIYYPKSTLGMPGQEENSETVIIPNPASAFTRVEFFREKAGSATITIRNLQGTTVFQEQVRTRNGQNSVRLGLGQLSKGFYLLSVDETGTSSVCKFIIQ